MKVEVLGNFIGTHDIRFLNETGATVFVATLDRQNIIMLVDKLLGVLYPEAMNEEE